MPLSAPLQSIVKRFKNSMNVPKEVNHSSNHILSLRNEKHWQLIFVSLILQQFEIKMRCIFGKVRLILCKILSSLAAGNPLNVI